MLSLDFSTYSPLRDIGFLTLKLILKTTLRLVTTCVRINKFTQDSLIFMIRSDKNNTRITGALDHLMAHTTPWLQS